MLSAIWSHLCNLKNVKHAAFLKVALVHGYFYVFYIENGTRLRSTSHMSARLTAGIT